MIEKLDQIRGLVENEFLWNGKSNFAAIIGLNPSKGARSPFLWNSIFFKKKIDTQMYPLDVTSANLLKLLNILEATDKFIGGAIAFPYKKLTAEYLGHKRIEEEVHGVGTVNSLYRSNQGVLLGSNTDGFAAHKIINDIIDINNANILIMGIGGVGRALAVVFGKAKCNLFLTSRSIEALEFSKRINSTWIKWEEKDQILPKINILINCTPLGSQNMLTDSPLDSAELDLLDKNSLVFDVVYQPIETKLLKISKSLRLKTLNGESMNIEQAVLAFNKAVRGIDQSDIRSIMGTLF
jgi:shikimate dehydrogenase